MQPLLDRFLRYVAIDTRADSEADGTPSSPGQLTLARLLADELRAIGVQDVRVDDHAYVVASLPGRGAAAGAPTIGLLAHLDTAEDFTGTNVKPRVVANYDGGTIELGAGMRLDPETFPVLKEKVGRTLVTTDGLTLLGADDKCGIAIIMAVLADLAANATISHPPIRVAFTPDEEIGHGAALLDLAAFGADFAYTLDGGGLGELEYENFNAAKATINIEGFSIHPGWAKGLMVNAALLGQEFLDGLPRAERPANTEGREGFFHVLDFKGDIVSARIAMLIRDHDRDAFEARKAQVRRLVDEINARWPSSGGKPRVVVDIQDQYRNMIEKIRPCMHIVDTAVAAIRAGGMQEVIVPIRGGTDGSQLSWRGLPTPNLFSGQYNMHGPLEFAVLEDMRASADTVIRILEAYALVIAADSASCGR